MTVKLGKEKVLANKIAQSFQSDAMDNCSLGLPPAATLPIDDKVTAKIPVTLVHSMAAAIFALHGIAIVLQAGAKLGV